MSSASARNASESCPSGSITAVSVGEYFFGSAQRFSRPQAFTARRVALMSSRDSIGGGPYVLEAAYPLGLSYPNRPSGVVSQRR